MPSPVRAHLGDGQAQGGIGLASIHVRSLFRALELDDVIGLMMDFLVPATNRQP